MDFSLHQPAFMLCLLFVLVEGCLEEWTVQGNIVQAFLHTLKAFPHLRLQHRTIDLPSYESEGEGML